MDYKEMAAIVKQRGDQIIAEKQARSVRIKKITAAAAGVCTAAAAAFALWNGGALSKASSKDFEEHSNIISSEDMDNIVPSTTVTNKNAEHTVTVTTAAPVHGSSKTSTVSIPQVSAISNSSITTTSQSGAEKIPDTAVSTAAYVSYQKPSVTTSAVKSHDIENYRPITQEEGITMIKKFLAALAAASTMTNTAPVSTSPIVRYGEDRYAAADNMEYFEKFDSGELRTDLNGDGNFDIRDCFAVFLCDNQSRKEVNDDNGNFAKYFTREERINIIGSENFDENGELIDPDEMIIQYNDWTFFNYYYNNNGIIPSDYDINNFCTLDGSIASDSWYMASYCRPGTLGFGYAEKYDKENNVSFDFNEDGITDIKDCFDFWIFSDYAGSWGGIVKASYAAVLDNYENVYYRNPGWMKLHYYDDLLGKEPIDGVSIPLNEYIHEIPLDETTIRNCAEYTVEHPFIDASISPIGTYMIRYFMKNYDFSEEWLDPQFCYDYFHNRVTSLGFTDDFTNEMIEHMSGINGYGYSYLGEARVLAIEAGLVNYNDYCDILTWHSPNPNYLKYTYAMYEQAIQNGEIAEPDMDGDGDLDEMDLTILGILYNREKTYRPIDDSFSNYIERCFSNMDFFDWEPDIEFLSKHFDCNNNGLSCDSSDALFAGIYVSKYGTIDRFNDNYNHSLFGFAEELMHAIPEGADGTKTPAHVYTPLPTERTGDASDDGVLKMNDAVLIMQTISNPDKYKLNSRGEFNADIYNTGDGITPMDALKVQRTLLED